MGLARHGNSGRTTLTAFASQIHPVFMLPPIAATLFGGLLGGGLSPAPAIAHGLAIFAAVYTAHLKDGYVDFHLRGEDEDHPLTVTGCRWGLTLSTGVFLFSLAWVYILVDWWALALTLPCWMIGYFHSPQLDMTTMGVTLGYPIGVGLALVGGAYVQGARIQPEVLAVALVLVTLLAGVKIIDDQQDIAYDRSIGKPTVAVTVGDDRARRIGGATFGLAVALLVAFVWLRLFPPATLSAGAGFGVLAWFSRGKTAEVATALLVRAGYVFLALLVAGFWYRPLA